MVSRSAPPAIPAKGHATERRSRFLYGPTQAVHGLFIVDRSTLWLMADFLAVLGFLAFVLAMLGLIAGLDHV
jgi:hypothetical protein